MSQETHSNNDQFRRLQHHKIATMLVRLLASLLVASCTVAQTGKLSAEKQAKIESAITKFMAASKAPGISAAVVQDGVFVWSAGFGMADLENSVPATSQTLYRLGSISKSIMATAAIVHVCNALASMIRDLCRLSAKAALMIRVIPQVFRTAIR